MVFGENGSPLLLVPLANWCRKRAIIMQRLRLPVFFLPVGISSRYGMASQNCDVLWPSMG